MPQSAGILSTKATQFRSGRLLLLLLPGKYIHGCELNDLIFSSISFNVIIGIVNIIEITILDRCMYLQRLRAPLTSTFSLKKLNVNVSQKMKVLPNDNNNNDDDDVVCVFKRSQTINSYPPSRYRVVHKGSKIGSIEILTLKWAHEFRFVNSKSRATFRG